MSGTGVVTLTQFAEIDHAAAGRDVRRPYDDQFAVLGNGLVNLTASATITDGDGDTATDSEVIDLGGNIRFADDGPSVDVTGDERGLGSADDAGRGDGRGPDERGHGGLDGELQRRVLRSRVRRLARTAPARRRR